MRAILGFPNNKVTSQIIEPKILKMKNTSILKREEARKKKKGRIIRKRMGEMLKVI